MNISCIILATKGILILITNLIYILQQGVLSYPIFQPILRLQKLQWAHNNPMDLLNKFHGQSYYQIATKIPTIINQNNIKHFQMI